MRKVEALEMPRGPTEAYAPMLRSIVRNLTAIERVRPGHPAVDRDRVGERDDLEPSGQ